jgi:hypothetical protein
MGWYFKSIDVSAKAGGVEEDVMGRLSEAFCICTTTNPDPIQGDFACLETTTSRL